MVNKLITYDYLYYTSEPIVEVEMMITKSSFGGFDNYVTVPELEDYFEYETENFIMRYKLKISQIHKNPIQIT